MERVTSLALIVLVALLAGVFAGRIALRAWTPGAPFVREASAVELQRVHAADFVGPCLVEFVVDGDTLAVRCGERAGHVELVDSDAPERGERGFAEAGYALRGLTGEGEFWLAVETPAALGATPSTPAHVYGADGLDVNAEMIRGGWSLYAPRSSARDDSGALARAEIDARVRRTGLWAP
jgi:endonuclease YncB( thermonuclease family)